MDIVQRPKATPIMVLKSIGLFISMGLGFGAAFYSGYNEMPYILAPCILLEVSCSTCFVLISRYLKGRLFQERSQSTIQGSFYLGCVLIVLSVGGCFALGITDYVDIEGFKYEKFGFYVAFVPCLLAVFWSCVLVYDAKYFLRMRQGTVINPGIGAHVIFRP